MSCCWGLIFAFYFVGSPGCHHHHELLQINPTWSICRTTATTKNAHRMTQQGAGTPQVCPLPAVHILQLGVCAAIFLSAHPTHQVSPSALGTCCAPHTSQYFKLPALYIPYQPKAQTPRATRPHMHGLCRLSHDNLQTGRPLRREPRRAPLVRAKVAAPVPPVLSPIDATITIS